MSSYTVEMLNCYIEELDINDEKERALTSPAVINYTNNFYADVKDTQIQQDTKNSNQNHNT